MSVFSLHRRMSRQHSGHTNVQQGDIRTAGLLEGVQHRKGGGIDGHLDAVLLMRGRINAKVLRDPLAVSGVVVANGYFQHRPASFAVFSVLYTAACRFASGRPAGSGRFAAFRAVPCVRSIVSAGRTMRKRNACALLALSVIRGSSRRRSLRKLKSNRAQR